MTRAPAPGNSVAVLYFDNLSRDSADAVLAAGLTEEIISRLGDIERLTVKSRYAVRRYRGSSVGDPASLGRQLAVGHIVTGSLQRSGSRLRVRVELARTSSGNRVWGQQYERADDDVFAIMADIAGNIVTGVSGSLFPAERVAIGARPTENRAAFDHLLRGDVMLALRTPLSVRRAVTEYEAATRLDPGLTTAWARMSVAYGIMILRGWSDNGRPPDDSLTARSLAAADRALALDSTNSDAWMAHGYAAMLRDSMGWTGAEQGFRRAVALNGRNAEAWHQLADLLGAMGKSDDATAAYRAALAAEPGRPVSLLSLAGTLPAREALAVCDTVLALDPSVNAYAIRAITRLRLGDTTGARADAASLERVIPVGAEMASQALAARLVLNLGDTANARARIRQIAESLPREGPLHRRIAVLVGAVLYDVGDREAGAALLERAPHGAYLWQGLGAARWQYDERIQRIFSTSRPPWVEGRP